MDSASFVAQHCADVQNGLISLSILLRKQTVREAVVTELPRAPREETAAPVSAIPVNMHRGSQAVTLATYCYRDINIHPAYSQKAARRSPGVLWFSPSVGDRQEIDALVREINQAKDAIQEHITTHYSTRQERFEALRRDCPAVMTLHLYRNIRCYTDQALTSVRFSWQQKDLVNKVRKDKLIQDMADEQERASPERQEYLQKVLTRLAVIPEHQLRTRREVQAQPAANVLSSTGLSTINAPMPIIVLQESDLEIKPLNDFDPTRSRKARADRKVAELVGQFNGLQIEVWRDPGD